MTNGEAALKAMNARVLARYPDSPPIDWKDLPEEIREDWEVGARAAISNFIFGLEVRPK